MNSHDGLSKLRSLVGALTDCDRRRSYYLSVATCYCSVKAVGEFIDAVRKQLRVKGIYLYLDRRTAISIGHEELKQLENDYREVLSIYAIKAGRLFHTKGYCLAAYDGEELVEGRLAIGSANLTNPGLTKSNGNIESITVHSDLSTIREFLEFFDDEENLIALDNLSKFGKKDTTDFQYALLQCGLFSHKWSALLAAYCSVRFQLSVEGRQRAQGGFEELGFQTDAVSIAKTYFSFDLARWQTNDRNLIKKYGIECFLGHWVPKSVVDADEEGNSRFKQFKTTLFDELDSKMESILQNILRDYDLLTEEGVIDAPEADPARTFGEKIKALRNDDVQLYRIWSGRHYFEFPYDLADVKKIRETYDDVLQSVRRRKIRNRAMSAVLEADAERSLKPLQVLVAAER